MDTLILFNVTKLKSMHKAQIRGDSFVLENLTLVDERENWPKFYAMYNSLRTQTLRISFSEGDLDHPSKPFVDFMINEVTSSQ